MKNEPSFNSKILLFGEYSIIQDSMGLTLPYNEFQGKLTFDVNEMNEQFVSESNDHLQDFANYLEQLLKDKKLTIEFDIDAFKNDIENGMYFQSSIPQGFGVGSSGALVAAVYGKYTKNKISIDDAPNKETILSLKAVFAKMESYFHAHTGSPPTYPRYRDIQNRPGQEFPKHL